MMIQCIKECIGMSPELESDAQGRALCHALFCVAPAPRIARRQQALEWRIVEALQASCRGLQALGNIWHLCICDNHSCRGQKIKTSKATCCACPQETAPVEMAHWALQAVFLGLRSICTLHTLFLVCAMLVRKNIMLSATTL